MLGKPLLQKATFLDHWQLCWSWVVIWLTKLITILLQSVLHHHQKKCKYYSKSPHCASDHFFVTIPSSVTLEFNANERDSTRMQLSTLTVCFFTQITSRVSKTVLALHKVVNRKAVVSDMQMRFFSSIGPVLFLTPGRCGCASIVILGDTRSFGTQ